MVGGDRNLFVRKGDASQKSLGNTGLHWDVLMINQNRLCLLIYRCSWL